MVTKILRRWTKWFYSSTAKSLRDSMQTVRPELSDYMEARSMDKSNKSGRNFVPSASLPPVLEMSSALQAPMLFVVCVCAFVSTCACLLGILVVPPFLTGQAAVGDIRD